MKCTGIAMAAVLLFASSELPAGDLRLKPDGRGGFKVRDDYGNYGRIRRSGNNWRYSGDDLGPRQNYYYAPRAPHMQYDPFTDDYYPSYGARVGVYPWMFR